MLIASDSIDRPEIDCFGLDVTVKRVALVAADHWLADAREMPSDLLDWDAQDAPLQLRVVLPGGTITSQIASAHRGSDRL